ncbi:MAG: hypothetical protein Q8O87_02660, partial [bacterium]|nr:hypothetical protein [bacterium]
FSAPALNTKDSNTILKVTPDRTCDKWLACRSYIKDEKGNNTCFDVGLCDAVDENGNCQSFITSPKENQTAESLGADKISNLSGYAKVGITGGKLLGDYYPFGAMKQAGEVVNLANGGFEYYGANGYPVGWSWSWQEAAGKSWDANIFSVINNPISAQAEGIGYAREGRSFLKLGSSYDATSEEVDVIPNADYIITAYSNTKNLKSGQARIDIVNSAGAPINSAVITQNLGNDWQFEVGRFSSGNNSRIKIKLYSSAGGAAGSEGNFYFDDIKVRPAIESKCLEADGDCKTEPYKAWYTTQSCRLYSKTDSLSCDYYEDSGNRQKGWYGYCLEYDRAPGNPNACILWYPVDKVKGDGIEEGAGYQGKVPVYYCMEAEPNCQISGTLKTSVDNAHTTYFNGVLLYSGAEWANPPESANVNLNIGKNVIAIIGTDWGAVFGIDSKFFPSPCFDGLIVSTDSLDHWKCTGEAPPANWMDMDFDDSTWPQAIRSNGGSTLGGVDGIWAKSANPAYCRGTFYNYPVCTKIVQTVSSVGQNKYWASRVYKGSDYEVDCNQGFPWLNQTCNYISDNSPFGSVVPPNASYNLMLNPYEWDGTINTKDNIRRPLLYVDGGVPRMGQAHNQTSVKKLFAQSYGSWIWTPDGLDGRYQRDNFGWGPPGTPTNVPNEPNNGLCNGNGTGVRAANSYCAILPVVDNDANPGNGNNIKVNGIIGNVVLTKNGFVNLTFNTKVDSNQLPLVMYAVEWGDGESTTVTGVEMRDRPNADVPHSLYHLYSYWDLKAKDNQTPSKLNGDCGTNCKADGYCTDYTGAYCRIKPKVQIKDNWGWCNHGGAINDCGQWENFGGSVLVKEK